jgi:hypothetical protein
MKAHIEKCSNKAIYRLEDVDEETDQTDEYSDVCKEWKELLFKILWLPLEVPKKEEAKRSCSQNFIEPVVWCTGKNIAQYCPQEEGDDSKP